MLIEIDYRDKRPLYEQIAKKFEELILKGIMKPDESMPSIRQLAIELSINPNTIQKSYAALETSGLRILYQAEEVLSQMWRISCLRRKKNFMKSLRLLLKKHQILAFQAKN